MSTFFPSRVLYGATLCDAWRKCSRFEIGSAARQSDFCTWSHAATRQRSAPSQSHDCKIDNLMIAIRTRLHAAVVINGSSS